MLIRRPLDGLLSGRLIGGVLKVHTPKEDTKWQKKVAAAVAAIIPIS